jgi:hypothetical protein
MRRPRWSGASESPPIPRADLTSKHRPSDSPSNGRDPITSPASPDSHLSRLLSYGQHGRTCREGRDWMTPDQTARQNRVAGVASAAVISSSGSACTTSPTLTISIRGASRPLARPCSSPPACCSGACVPLGGALLLVWALLNLLGGAVLSVLALPFLPFLPEQSLRHYSFHLLYGLTQVPLLLAGLDSAEGPRTSPCLPRRRPEVLTRRWVVFTTSQLATRTSRPPDSRRQQRLSKARHVERRMRGDTARPVRRRARETDPGQPGHRARARPNRSDTDAVCPTSGDGRSPLVNSVYRVLEPYRGPGFRGSRRLGSVMPTA